MTRTESKQKKNIDTSTAVRSVNIILYLICRATNYNVLKYLQQQLRDRWQVNAKKDF